MHADQDVMEEQDLPPKPWTHDQNSHPTGASPSPQESESPWLSLYKTIALLLLCNVLRSTLTHSREKNNYCSFYFSFTTFLVDEKSLKQIKELSAFLQFFPRQQKSISVDEKSFPRKGKQIYFYEIGVRRGAKVNQKARTTYEFCRGFSPWTLAYYQCVRFFKLFSTLLEI